MWSKNKTFVNSCVLVVLTTSATGCDLLSYVIYGDGRLIPCETKEDCPAGNYACDEGSCKEREAPRDSGTLVDAGNTDDGGQSTACALRQP